jgi:hypothetical protein
MDDPTQSEVVGTTSVAVVVGRRVGETGFFVVVGGSTMAVPLPPLCDETSPPVGTGETRWVVELVPDPVGNTVTPVPAVPDEMMLEIMLSKPVDDAVGVGTEELGSKVVVAPVPVAAPVPVGMRPPMRDDRRPPPLDELRV